MLWPIIHAPGVWNPYYTIPYKARGAVAVTTLLFAALRADHCRTLLAPLRGVQGFRGAPRRTHLPK